MNLDQIATRLQIEHDRAVLRLGGLEQLIEHVLPYIQHKPGCSINENPDYVCSCGLDGPHDELIGYFERRDR